MSKKILHIVESFASGIFSFLINLVNSTENEFEIVIAYGERKETPEDFEKYFNNRVKFIKVENFTRNLNPVKDVKAFLEIKNIIKNENPDIIHLHSSKAGFIGRFAANGKKKKILYNPHGFSFLMQDTSKMKRTLYWMFEKMASFRKCTIIGCSKGEYQEALKLSKNSICINNGVDLTKLKKDSKNLKPSKIDLNNLKICTLGRIGYQKNPELFNEIAKSFPKLTFTWIGDGDLKHFLTSPNVKVTGWKECKEVLEILNNNDIFILTSLWEGLPISLLEALFMKKFCIVNNCIGNRDVINNKNGLLCNNLDDFKKAIQDIQKGKIEIEPMICNGYKDIEEIYNTENMIKEYKKVYNN